jgi:uncharacterized protein YciW
MTTDAERREATDQWTVQLREQQLRDLRAQLATANQRAETAEADVKVLEARLENDYYKRRTEELATELHQLRTELADVLETALIRGESLGYVEIDDDYRARLQELNPDAEILQDIE